MKELLKLLFNRDTKVVQSANLFINTIWLILFIFSLFDVITLDISKDLTHIEKILSLAFISVFLTFISLKSKKEKKQLFKVAGLVCGALFQAILSNYYITAYPPFEPMLIVCSLLSTWFLLAIMYIAFVEGMDGKLRSD
nr:MAG: hypothetical protein [Enquatrovirus sp.]